jgi:serine protease Do
MKKSFLIAACLPLLFLPPVFAAQDGGIESLRQTGKAFSSVARKVSPSVVFIHVEGRSPDAENGTGDWPFQDDLLRRFFGDDFPGLARPAPKKPRRAISTIVSASPRAVFNWSTRSTEPPASLM